MKVLMFHNVENPPKKARLKSLYVKPERFKRWLNLLNRLNFRFVKPQELEPKGRGSLYGSKGILITCLLYHFYYFPVVVSLWIAKALYLNAEPVFQELL